MSLALRTKGLLHVRKVSIQINLCSLQRLIKGNTEDRATCEDQPCAAAFYEASCASNLTDPCLDFAMAVEFPFYDRAHPVITLLEKQFCTVRLQQFLRPKSMDKFPYKTVIFLSILLLMLSLDKIQDLP
ncbi:hypothetical protein DPMN_065672 [Dreissena polymorpha]|uniref:Uncharacterized protein n=1 Tax=Dreissena polymorpha TaxID=45954 RepID=A0A9D3YWW7_DREPO|nr:hypothetical protein DPMN_065672 [Dreissena polymorpha]